MSGNRVIGLLDVLLTLKIRDLKYYLKKKTGYFYAYIILSMYTI